MPIATARRWLKGWWTIIFNGAIALAVIVMEFMPFLLGFQWRGVVDAATAAWIVLALNLANIGLRMITTTPPGKAE